MSLNHHSCPFDLAPLQHPPLTQVKNSYTPFSQHSLTSDTNTQVHLLKTGIEPNYVSNSTQGILCYSKCNPGGITGQ
jgi:hypothetical protein